MKSSVEIHEPKKWLVARMRPLKMIRYKYTVSKNDTDVERYNFNAHQLILVPVPCVKNHYGRTYFDEFMPTCLRGAVF